MRNETNRWSIFFWQNFNLKAKFVTIFTCLIITNFKTDRYLNNFQEQFF